MTMAQHDYLDDDSTRICTKKIAKTSVPSWQRHNSLLYELKIIKRDAVISYSTLSKLVL
jgi:hypothetical protein